MANDKLTTYKAKRDFRQTREPSGQEPVKPTNRRRFVIQKHDACTSLPHWLLLNAARCPGRRPKASPTTSVCKWRATIRAFI
jgi:hypothetical protein